MASGWANVGSAIAGNPARQAALYEQGATGTARLEGLLSEARLKRDQEAGLAGITPEAIAAATAGDPAAQANIASVMFHADKNPEQLSSYQKQTLGNRIQQDIYDQAKGGAPISSLNPLLAAFEGKVQDVSRVQDGVSYNPTVAPDQNKFDPTQVGFAEIMQKGAQAEASKASAANSYASAAKTRGEIADANAKAPGGGKAADWSIQTDAAGNIFRVNKLTGDALQVTSPDGKPVQNKQALAAQSAVQSAQGAQESFKTALDTLDELKDSPGLSRSVGWTGAWPTAPGSDSANFQAKLESFKAQTFLPMVQNLRGLGALSDAEGSKLSNAVGTLSQKQSEQQFRTSLGTIRSTLIDAQKRARANAGAVSSITTRGQSPAQAATPQATPAAASSPTRAVNPATGHAVVWNGTSWVDE